MFRRQLHSILAAAGISLALATVAFAGPVTVLYFQDTSTATAGIDHKFQTVTNGIFTTDPTSADAAQLATHASAFTDGHGFSGLNLESTNHGIDARAETVEFGQFHANTDVTMRMQAFFPGIELFGVFLDTTSFIRYTVEVDVYNVFTRFETTGTLTSSGFVSSGEDIGAVFNASHHTVTVAPFFLNVDLDNVPPGPFRAGDDFSVTVTKTLEYHGANSVEIASGDIIDPNHISAPIRNGLIFTEVTGVPEPGSFLAVAAALALILRRARLKA